jgi:hypothetical protein
MARKTKTRAERFLSMEEQVLSLQDQIEALRWEEAQVIWEEWYEEGASLTAIGREIGKSRAHVTLMKNAWERRDECEEGMSFNQHYNSAIVRQRGEG